MKVFFLGFSMGLAALTGMAHTELLTSSSIPLSTATLAEQGKSVQFINKSWSTMHLQIRTGDREPADANPLTFDRNLAKGEQVTIPFDVLLYYRRDSNPDNPNGQYTAWVSYSQSAVNDTP